MIYMVITTPFGGLGLDIDKFFSNTTSTTAYPPHNLIKFNDDEYTLQFAVAGFKKDDISITTEKSVLKITGQMAEPQFEDGAGYVHKGIAGRRFSRSFSLPEYFEVNWAGMEDGILSVGMIRNIPEEKKPKQIAIS
jgi:molecular chaperone IbpA